jgi:hypothetical protein
MTTSAAAIIGIEDRDASGGGSDEDGGRVDLADDFLPISWSLYFTVLRPSGDIRPGRP